MKISFLYAAVAGVFLLSVAGQTLAAEKTDGTDNYNFAGHKFNRRSAVEFQQLFDQYLIK